MSLKNPVTPPGIDPGTIGLVEQRLNHYATPGPLIKQIHLLSYHRILVFSNPVKFKSDMILHYSKIRVSQKKNIIM
jgi:hypothetical protein